MPVLIVRECPHCRAYVVEEDTLSGITIGAKYYTDGKRGAKMLPDHPALPKCPKCSRLFWTEESVEVDVGFDAAKGKQQVLAPSGEELLAYLASATCPRRRKFTCACDSDGPRTMPGDMRRIRSRPFPRSRLRISKPCLRCWTKQIRISLA